VGFVAERYPGTRITAVSNSSTQRAYIQECCAKRRLSKIEVITADMNDFDIDRRFDRVVSIEMFEHMRNYEELLRRLAGWLSDEGQLFVHIFCHRRHAYLFEAGSADDWMGRYFFTAGLMPSEDLLLSFNRHLRVRDRWYVDGRHYAKTANAWLANLDAHRSALMPIPREAHGDEADLWFMRWRLFFMACAELFGYADGSEWGVWHYTQTR